MQAHLVSIAASDGPECDLVKTLLGWFLSFCPLAPSPPSGGRSARTGKCQGHRLRLR